MKARLAVLVASVVLPMVVGLEVTFRLLFGWIFYLGHVLPSVSWSAEGFGFAAVSLIGFVLVLNSLARWYRGETHESAPHWQWRWTLAIVAMIILTFVAGVAMVGIVHQAGWLLTDGPLYKQQLVGDTPTGHLKSIGLGIFNRESTHGRLPGSNLPQPGTAPHSWTTQCLPAWNVMTDQLDWSRPWDDPQNSAFFKTSVTYVLNTRLDSAPTHDRNGYGLSHFAANGWVMGWRPAMRLHDITDGTSQTLLVGEINEGFLPWGHPGNWRDPCTGLNTSPHGFGGPAGAGGVNFLMADGSVRFVADGIDPRVLRALATPAAGDDVRQ